MSIIKNKKTEMFKNLKMFIYADSFAGKTTFALTFPKPLLFSTDGNYKSFDVDVIPIADEMSRKTATGIEIKESGWLYFKKMLDEYANSDEYETFVIDLTKDIYDFCRNYVLKQNGVTHESEMKVQGKIWTLIDNEFLPVLRKLMTLQKNVILIAHEKENEMGQFKPSLIDSVIKKVNSYSDILCRIRVEKQIGQTTDIRRLYLRPVAGQAGGTRFGDLQPIDNPTYEKLINEIKRANALKGE